MRLPFARLSVLAVAMCAIASPAIAQKSPGEQIYGQRCQTCHSMAAGAAATLGPNLRGVVGRKAGSTGFRYSSALKGVDIVWTAENLDRFLTAPSKMVPGTRMITAIADAKQRAALLEYLAKQK